MAYWPLMNHHGRMRFGLLVVGAGCMITLMGYSIADWCSIAGIPIGVFGVEYAVYQQRRADREVLKRKHLASEAQRFLVGYKRCENDQRSIDTIEDQLERLKESL
jgi:hypothetical protein